MCTFHQNEMVANTQQAAAALLAQLSTLGTSATDGPASLEVMQELRQVLTAMDDDSPPIATDGEDSLATDDLANLEDRLMRHITTPGRHEALAQVSDVLARYCATQDTPTALQRLSPLTALLVTPGVIDLARLYRPVQELLAPLEQFFLERRTNALCAFSHLIVRPSNHLAIDGSALEHYSPVYLNYLCLCVKHNVRLVLLDGSSL
jgi:hypothetical protein